MIKLTKAKDTEWMGNGFSTRTAEFAKLVVTGLLLTAIKKSQEHGIKKT